MIRECGHDHTPNAETQLAMYESRMKEAKRVIVNLLRHSVYDETRNDECSDAVDAARAFLSGVPR
jgi:hypothetical protein